MIDLKEIKNTILKKENFYFLAIIFFIFGIDRYSKIEIINNFSEISFYLNDFLNFDLIWNTGIGFGLISLETNVFYHVLTILIGAINIVLIVLLIKFKGIYAYLIALIIGGSLGNLFDRVYYYAVPDFIDIHIGNFHWFIFNVADIFITVGIIGLILTELLRKEKISKNA